MKYSLLLGVLLLISTCGISQDLIVTDKGDSLNARISKVKLDYIYFAFKHKGEIRNTLISVASVKDYKYNFYQTSLVPKDKVKPFYNYPRFRIALNGGFSYEIASLAKGLPSGLKDYYNELKSGYHFGGDMTYFVSEVIGFGVKYVNFHSSNSLSNVTLFDNYGNTRSGKMSDDIAISYIGPTFTSRYLSNTGRNSFLSSVSLGYVHYIDDAVLIEYYKIRGGTVGMNLELAYETRLAKNLYLGVQVSLLAATLFSYDFEDATTSTHIELEKGEYESLNRLDFSFGLRYCR